MFGRKSPLRIPVWLVCVFAGEVVTGSPLRAEAPASGERFETQIRPLFVEHCQRCHGIKKQEMGLRLDSAVGLNKGSDSGPVVVAGEPDRSLLIEAVRYAGDTKMPPAGKLTAKEIDALTAWVKDGAKWPAAASPLSEHPVSPSEKGKPHWAFQPIGNPPLPTVALRSSANEPAWATSSIDAFILARLDAAGLSPSPTAARRDLVRRATFDLLGIPPTPDEVVAFESDSSPDAFERLIDRLLASPRYGERWGRHWLDVARYADTKGYVRLNENPNYPSAWTYRDYVVRALNEDLPYDWFVLEQLAADQLPPREDAAADDPRPLAAMGFLTLGQRFINSRNDIIDDRIDVVSRGLMGLTVTCARCHDHKFDPIPTRDYYSLHGIFASSVEPRVPPLVVRSSERERFAAYLAQLDERTAKLDTFLRERQATLATDFTTRIGEYLFAGQHELVQPNFLAVMFLIDSTKELNPVMTQRWARYLDQSRKKHDPIFAPWHALAKLAADSEFPANGAAVLAGLSKQKTGPERVNQVVVEALTRAAPADLKSVAVEYGRLLNEAVTPAKQIALPEEAVADWAALAAFMASAHAPQHVSLASVDEFLFVDTNTQSQLQQQQRLIEDWIASPGAAPHAMTLVDSAAPADTRVFIRGNASNPGEVAPRGFLSALSHGKPQPFAHGSGRLELARAIASPDNPLTARVLVNRVWLHHFGQGLVRTPSDFGVRGDPPMHPELLDHLASRFMADGWSVKALHRKIVASATYRQQSAHATSAARERDPENRLLSRMNRRRLDWESFRDAMLAVSGQLDQTIGGPSADLFKLPYSPRRSIYGLIDRQNVPGTLRAFDFVAPDATSPKRHETTVPQQALFLLNSPLLKDYARNLIARADVAGHASPRDRIDALYRLLFGRPANTEEIRLGEDYVESGQAESATGAALLNPWEEYAQALLLSNEFMFVD